MTNRGQRMASIPLIKGCKIGRLGCSTGLSILASARAGLDHLFFRVLHGILRIAALLLSALRLFRRRWCRARLTGAIAKSPTQVEIANIPDQNICTAAAALVVP